MSNYMQINPLEELSALLGDWEQTKAVCEAYAKVADKPGDVRVARHLESNLEALRKFVDAALNAPGGSKVNLGLAKIAIQRRASDVNMAHSAIDLNEYQQQMNVISSSPGFASNGYGQTQIVQHAKNLMDACTDCRALCDMGLPPFDALPKRAAAGVGRP